jgi:hypothetical protein
VPDLLSRFRLNREDAVCRGRIHFSTDNDRNRLGAGLAGAERPGPLQTSDVPNVDLLQR